MNALRHPPSCACLNVLHPLCVSACCGLLPAAPCSLLHILHAPYLGYLLGCVLFHFFLLTHRPCNPQLSGRLPSEYVVSCLQCASFHFFLRLQSTTLCPLFAVETHIRWDREGARLLPSARLSVPFPRSHSLPPHSLSALVLISQSPMCCCLSAEPPVSYLTHSLAPSFSNPNPTSYLGQSSETKPALASPRAAAVTDMLAEAALRCLEGGDSDDDKVRWWGLQRDGRALKKDIVSKCRVRG